MDQYDRVKEAADAVHSKIADVPNVGIVLGSGLGDFANSLEQSVSMPYDTLPHWPASRVVGHEGRLVVGRSRGKTVAALAGRCHLYEGHDVSTVVFAVRALRLLGVETILLTNAAGGVNTGFAQGALMVIDDHINLTGANPLVGPNDTRFGPRFPDMSEVYASRLRSIADRAGKSIDLVLPHGIYAALLGPSYETPAEIRYLRKIGADAVGMSTVHEAIAARHMGMQVLGISCITNMAAGVLPAPLDHEEVMATARKVRGQFVSLLEGILEQL
ncbi:MAG TPA: purine-nucleoside phosphorylase [Vicinamibacterales bacterium]|jgi:purine-nucleoside phosphorylase